MKRLRVLQTNKWIWNLKFKNLVKGQLTMRTAKKITKKLIRNMDWFLFGPCELEKQLAPGLKQEVWSHTEKVHRELQQVRGRIL